MWMQHHYDANPYVVPSAGVPGYKFDPLLHNDYPYSPIHYGFLFAEICRLICALGHGEQALSVFLFKGLNWLAYIALVPAIYFVSKRLGARRPDLSVYLFMWNPIILLQSLSNGHNDILMALLVVAAFAALLYEQVELAMVAFVAAVLIKGLWLIGLPFV